MPRGGRGHLHRAKCLNSEFLKIPDVGKAREGKRWKIQSLVSFSLKIIIKTNKPDCISIF